MSDPAPKKEKTRESEIRTIYKSFQSNLDSLKLFIDTLSPVALEKDSNQAETLVKILNDAFEKIGIDIKQKPENGARTREKALNKEELFLLANQLRKIPKVGLANSKILFQSSFVLLVGYFEYLFADLLKFYYHYFPGNISDKPIQVVINELKSFENIDEAIDYVISKEVETILFDLSFNELTEFFKNKLKINLEVEIINWDIMNETRERRHIIVHNNSVINKKYLSKSKIDFLPDKDKEKIKLGEKINISKEYFDLAFSEIYSAGHLLIFNCWRQWVKDDTNTLYTEILNTTFDCLKLDLNAVAKSISLYAIRIEAKTDHEHDLLLRTKFNYYISLKQLNRIEELNSELDKIMISTLSPFFQMAYYVLKEDKEKILETVKHSKAIGKMKLEVLQEWPLFKTIRQNKELYKLIEDMLTEN